ncbi:exosome complex protein Rrp42 [Candidatus Woesearchaeota archaeon]|nr:exosome complex protein Rrp42 [Candidatus Woesearchaeota archaeon]
MIIVNKETIAQLALQDKRLDGRGLTEYRTPIAIETNISKTAEGSVRVQIGQTIILAGLKMAIEKPYNDTPDEGGIMINAELVPLSGPQYEPGPPGKKAVELARVVDRGIREAKAIDMKKLCLVQGEKAWFITIDLVTLNDAGNLLDAAGLAALAVLKEAVFPAYEPHTGVIDYKTKTDQHLPLIKEPLPVTVYKISGQLLVDLTSQEEDAFEARLTVASDEKGILSALQKGGEAPLSIEEIDRIIDLALEKAKFLRGQLK